MRIRECAVCRHLKRAKFVFRVAVVRVVLTRVVDMDIYTSSCRNKQRGYAAPAFVCVCVAGTRQGSREKENISQKKDRYHLSTVLQMRRQQNTTFARRNEAHRQSDVAKFLLFCSKRLGTSSSRLLRRSVEYVFVADLWSISVNHDSSQSSVYSP